MNKEELKEKLDDALEVIIGHEGDAAVASGFRHAIDTINEALDGYAIVPVETNYPRFCVRVDAVIDYMEPAKDTADSCQRDSAQSHLSAIACKLEPQVKELIYKAMLSASQQEEG